MRGVFLLSFFVICFFTSSAQWDPHAGLVSSYTDGAVLISSSNSSAAPAAVDGNNNSHWQSGGNTPALPNGYLVRPDLNILLGKGTTLATKNSSSANATNTTDGSPSTSVTIAKTATGPAWISYDLQTVSDLRTVSVKCGLATPVQIFAFQSTGDSVLMGTLMPGADHFQLRRFSPLLDEVVSIKLISTANFSLFEVAAMSTYPTEYLIVDFGQPKTVGYIQTRHWANGNAVATAFYTSNDMINWTLVDTADPDAFLAVVTRPSAPLQARYVKIEHSLKEVDYAKANVWEIAVYDENGPYGAFPPAKPHYLSVKNILGVNGLWGWGHNVFSSSIPQGQGPTRFNTFSGHARNYHNLHWDVRDPDDTADYSGPWGLALWWLDWNREYKAWKDAGLKVQASIQFTEWNPATAMNKWDDPYNSAYKYGYKFARHFGPTYGNNLVDVMEIGNEPWTYPASFYLEVFRGMLKGAKDADPAFKVIPGAFQAGDPASEMNYLGARISAAEAHLLDGINVHHYSYTSNKQGVRIAVHPEHPESDMRGVVNDIRFRDVNLPGKKVYLSEWGWDSDGAGVTCTFGECVSENEQALYAVRGAMMFMRLGIDRITWYFYGNQGSGNIYSRSGLEGNDALRTEKKSLKAFQSFAHLLGDKHFLNVIKEDNDAWIYLFGDSLGTPSHMVAWRPIKGDDNSTFNIALPTVLQPDSAWKITGNSRTGEAVATPPYFSGEMHLTVSSTPLVIKVSPSTTTTYVWNGNVSGNWNTAINWDSYAVPDSIATVVIPPGRPNYPEVFPNDVHIHSLILQNSSSVSLEPGSNITIDNSLLIDGGTLNVSTVGGTSSDIFIRGNFTLNSGTFSPGAGTVTFNGNGPQFISGNVHFHDLKIDNKSSVTISDTVTAGGIVSVITGSELITNDNLIIESGGALMHGQDTPDDQQGTVNGLVTIKRKGSSHPQVFNYWSSPVENANANLLGGNRFYYDPGKAIDNSVSGLRAGWVAANGAMKHGAGYIGKAAGLVSFKGVAHSAPVAAPYSAEVKKNFGVQNDVTYNLIGNPFPSAMDAGKFLQLNGPAGSGVITGALYFWDDDRSGGSGWSAAQDYAVWNPVGLVAGPNSGQIFDGSIGSCQSFFVEKINDGSSNVFFDNSMRTGNNGIFFKQAPVERLWISLKNSAQDYNEILLGFLPDALDEWDAVYDAKKIHGHPNISFYSLIDTMAYAIQGLAPLTTEKTLPLGFYATTVGTFEISIKNIENIDPSVAVMLEDKQLNLFTNLRAQSYNFQTIAGKDDSRFVLHFNVPVEINSTAENCLSEPGTIELFQHGNQKWNFRIEDGNGNIISIDSNFSGLQNIDVPAGDYTILFSDNYGYQFSKNVTIIELKDVTAAFSFPVQQHYFVNEPLNFSDLSDGGDFNEWNFGDGTIINDQSQITHSYANAGTYNVSLRAWNNDCEDNSSETITISKREFISGVHQHESQAVSAFSAEGNIFISFQNFHSSTAKISLFDVTGKLIHQENMPPQGLQQLTTTKLAEAIYLVRVTTAEKVFTQRILSGN